ncbi:MAG: type II secretion system GspH family protein [Patescibacteria group bacterium]|nr:type II secretion system GspH family protein [Patescibacteria group bacterium]
MQSIRFLLSNRYNRLSAFTLVELLIVIGIISVLAVALLITINPTEAQRRARDSQRLRDLNSIQTMAESWINEGRAEFCQLGCSSNNGTTATTRTAAQACRSGHWMTDTDDGLINLCDFLKTVPVDPANALIRSCINSASGTITRVDCSMRYEFAMINGAYEIATMIESESNALKASQDGGGSGNEESWVQIRSGTGPSAVLTYTQGSP